MKRSFVESPPPPVFARLELMSDHFCVVNEAPTPPTPPTPVVGNARHPVTELGNARHPVTELGNARHPVTELGNAGHPITASLYSRMCAAPLNRGPSLRYIQKFKQRSSYDTVVTKADTQELFYDEYLTVEYKHANDKCMHVAKLCDSIQNNMKAAHSKMLSNHEKECMRLPLMPYQRFMKRQSFC